MVSKMKNFLKFKTGENKHDMRKFGEEFYLREAKLWRPFRWFGILSTLLAMALMIAAIISEDWMHGASKCIFLVSILKLLDTYLLGGYRNILVRRVCTRLIEEYNKQI